MQPWGLSGPAFLWLVVAGVVAGAAIAWYGWRWGTRRPPLTVPSTVDFAEAAQVAGGTDRVIDTVTGSVPAAAGTDPVLALARGQLTGVDLVAVDDLRATLVDSATPPGRGGEHEYRDHPTSSGGGLGGCGGGNP